MESTTNYKTEGRLTEAKTRKLVMEYLSEKLATYGNGSTGATLDLIPMEDGRRTTIKFRVARDRDGERIVRTESVVTE
jgi:hypothetical protein